MTTPHAQQPEHLHQLFITGVNAHDIEGLMALYEPASTTADLEGHLLQDLSALREFLTGLLTVVKRLDGETRRVLVAGDIALLSSTWRAVLVDGDGEIINVTGTSAEVARRQPDGIWRFLIDDPQFVNV